MRFHYVEKESTRVLAGQIQGQFTGQGRTVVTVVTLVAYKIPSLAQTKLTVGLGQKEGIDGRTLMLLLENGSSSGPQVIKCPDESILSSYCMSVSQSFSTVGPWS